MQVNQKTLSHNNLNRYLPEFKFSKLKEFHHLNEVKDCCICLCDFEGEELLRVTFCRHFLHKQCIDDWLIKNENCPLCR